MRVEVKRFVERCRVFQYAKGKTKNIGMYHPLHVPSITWYLVSMDFILGFPRTQRNHDSILVAVDKFLKMAHFIPCFNTSDATHIENLFFKYLVRLHGLPKIIIYDRDTIFVWNLWRILWKKLRTNMNFSLAYHPQIDGQIEVVNKILVNILRSFVSEHLKQWDEVLA